MPLPVQKLANAAGLPLADDKLLIVTQSDQPSLAAECAHLPDVINIHQRVSMDSSKAGISETLLEDFQRLRRQILPFRGQDPDRVAIGLKCVDLGGVQEKILFTDFPHDLSGPGGFVRAGDLLQMRQPLHGLPPRHAPGPV
jgi:hypothetical protein